jgi:PAS domain S-box-containing protein
MSQAGDSGAELLDAMPDAVLVADRNGCIVQANAQAVVLFGYARNELLGQPVEMLLPERSRAQHLSRHAQFAAAPWVRAMGSGRELQALRKGGQELPVEISLSPLHVAGEALVIAAVRDVTERHAERLALELANRQLEAAMQAKDRFLAAMSHELRTPLNSIIGFTGTLLMNLAGPLTPEQESQLRSVQGSGRHLLALINDLLEVARLDSDAPRLQGESVDCRAELGEAIASLVPGAELKGLALAVDCAQPVVQARLDRRAFRQVLLNLVANAIKYTDRGSVTVRLEQHAEPAPGEIVVRVADTGRGISGADLGRLFKPFSRIEHGDNRGEGSGLGLYLARRLVEAQGGTLDCASEPGRGSEFTVRLPVACQAAS